MKISSCAQVGEPTPYNTSYDPDDGSVVDW